MDGDFRIYDGDEDWMSDRLWGEDNNLLTPFLPGFFDFDPNWGRWVEREENGHTLTVWENDYRPDSNLGTCTWCHTTMYFKDSDGTTHDKCYDLYKKWLNMLHAQQMAREELERRTFMHNEYVPEWGISANMLAIAEARLSG